MRSSMHKNDDQAKLERYLNLQRELHRSITDSKQYADVSKLTEALESQDINYQIPHNGSTALHIAVTTARSYEQFKLSFVEFLINRGADPTIANHKGQTVVHCTLYQFKYDPKYYLLETGWVGYVLTTIHIERNNGMNYKDSHGLSHFHVVCIISDLSLVEFFLNNRVSIDEAVNTDSPIYPGYTPLHFAVQYGSVELVDKLLSHGADVRLKDSGGMTPLHVLVKRNIEIIEHVSFRRILMHEYTEERDFPDEKSAMQLSAELENNWNKITNILEDTDESAIKSMDLFPFYVARRLRDTSFDWSRNDINECINFDSTWWPGYTALHFAAHFDIDTVKLLLEEGADVEAKDAYGVTPFDLCAGRYSVGDIHSIIASHNVWKNILLSDGKTKLLDLVLAMRKPEDLTKFLNEIQQNINGISIPWDSPLWPGFSILHLVVTLSKKAMRFRAATCLPYFSEDFLLTKSYLRGLSPGYDLIRRPDELIKVCLDSGADVTAQDSNGSSPIHLAVRRLDLECMYFLLERCQGNSNPTDKDNLSLLHIACLVEDATLVKQLVSIGADPNATVLSSFQWDPDLRYFYDLNAYRRLHIRTGFTPLHVCMTRLGQPAIEEIVKMLMEAGANIHAKDVDGLSPLHWQIAQAHSTDVFDDTLLSQIISEDCVVDGLSYLHIAAHHKYLKFLEKLLDIGANVNSVIAASEQRVEFNFSHPNHWCSISSDLTTPAFDVKDYEGNTPLHMVLQHCYKSKHYDVAKILISRGADVLVKNSDKGWSPICRILREQRFELCLLRCYLSVMSKKDEERIFDKMGLTRLHIACQLCDVEMIRQCLENRMNVNARIHDDSEIWCGFTPLHVLVREQSCNKKICEAVRLLLDGGADVTIVDAKGESPLMINIEENHIVKRPAHMDLLWEKLRNSHVNPVSDKGISHFHLACIRNDLDLVERFLKLGVDPNQTVDHSTNDHPGYTPLHFAVSSQVREKRDSAPLKTINLLLMYGANVNARNKYHVTPLHVAGWNLSLGALPYKRLLCAGADPQVKRLPFGGIPRCWVLEDAERNLLRRFIRFVGSACLSALRRACIRILYGPIDKRQVKGVNYSV